MLLLCSVQVVSELGGGEPEVRLEPEGASVGVPDHRALFFFVPSA